MSRTSLHILVYFSCNQEGVVILMNVLQVEHMMKNYGDRCVVHDVCMTIEEGECFGLIGHNGAGKSTTLECILQVKKADKGTIYMLGKEIHKKDKELFQHIGVQFQESGYPDKMKVKEVCNLTATMYTKALDWKELLKQFHLEKFENSFINELSGGERQRLSVLLAMLPDPKLLFLDELTTGLDAQARRELWGYILDYKKKGNGVLLTSHYMDEVEKLCDRIGIMKAGVMVFCGSVEEAKRQSGCSTLEDAYLWYNNKEEQA